MTVRFCLELTDFSGQSEVFFPLFQRGIEGDSATVLRGDAV